MPALFLLIFPLFWTNLHIWHMLIDSVDFFKLIRSTWFCNFSVFKNDNFINIVYVLNKLWNGFLYKWFVVNIKRCVASSIRIIGASLRNALAIDILCLSPPESSEPFSSIILFHLSGNFSINSSQCASLATAFTSSSIK